MGCGFLGETLPLKEAFLIICTLRAKANTVLPVWNARFLSGFVLRLGMDELLQVLLVTLTLEQVRLLSPLFRGRYQSL